MEASLIIAVAAVGGNVLIAAGLVATWSRNGRSQASKYGSLETVVRNTGEKVDDLTATVKGLDCKVDKFQNHCADISGRMDERLLTTEREIRDLK